MTSTIESDGLRSGRNRGMATIRDRVGHMFAIQRLGSIQYLLIKGNLRRNMVLREGLAKGGWQGVWDCATLFLLRLLASML